MRERGNEMDLFRWVRFSLFWEEHGLKSSRVRKGSVWYKRGKKLYESITKPDREKIVAMATGQYKIMKALNDHMTTLEAPFVNSTESFRGLRKIAMEGKQ
jgi:hypothetical protein